MDDIQYLMDVFFPDPAERHFGMTSRYDLAMALARIEQAVENDQGRSGGDETKAKETLRRMWKIVLPLFDGDGIIRYGNVDAENMDIASLSGLFPYIDSGEYAKHIGRNTSNIQKLTDALGKRLDSRSYGFEDDRLRNHMENLLVQLQTAAMNGWDGRKDQNLIGLFSELSCILQWLAYRDDDWRTFNRTFLDPCLS